MNIFKRLTYSCNKEDCQIVSYGPITTLVHWVAVYDRDGNSLNKNPNSITTNYECKKCGKRWIHNVNEASDIDMITEIRL
mgnify:CR=1 FL=1